MPYFEIEGKGKKSGRKWKPRVHFAKSEQSALRKAKEEGMKPENVRLMGIWHCVRQVAGCSHKNRDNSSRQDIVKQCKDGEPLMLKHEIGNRYDKHAIKVLRENGDQVGYLPQDLAHDVIEGYWKDSGCKYWAANLGMEEINGYSDMMTIRILLVASYVSVSEADFSVIVKQHIANEGLSWARDKRIVSSPLEATEFAGSNEKTTAPTRSSNSGCLNVLLTSAIALGAILTAFAAMIVF